MIYINNIWQIALQDAMSFTYIVAYNVANKNVTHD